MSPLTAVRAALRRRTQDATSPTADDVLTHNPSGATANDTADDVHDAVVPIDTATQDRVSRTHRIVGIILPVIALVLACGGGYLKWFEGSADTDARAAVESVRAASDNTIAILSYKADTAERDLGAASSRLTGEFKKSYLSLTQDVVIPGAKQDQIGSAATVPAAASISATENHAVVLLFVNQTITMGQTPPTDTASSVRVTLDNVDGHWLISGFDPI